jgi:hypothetical protein
MNYKVRLSLANPISSRKRDRSKRLRFANDNDAFSFFFFNFWIGAFTTRSNLVDCTSIGGTVRPTYAVRSNLYEQLVRSAFTGIL